MAELIRVGSRTERATRIAARLRNRIVAARERMFQEQRERCKRARMPLKMCGVLCMLRQESVSGVPVGA
jgi:hypothetical protein